MRQAFAWSLVGLVFVASLLVCPLPAGAGDPDIPLYRSHRDSSARRGQGTVQVVASRTDQKLDPPPTAVDSPAPRLSTLWETLARWMISNAVRAGH